MGETLPIEGSQKGGVGSGGDPAVADKLGFEDMKISKPIEKKPTSGLEDLLDFEDVGVKPTASSEKKETWDWDDDDLEEWLSVEK